MKLHVSHILAKLNLTSRVEAAIFAVQRKSTPRRPRAEPRRGGGLAVVRFGREPRERLAQPHRFTDDDQRRCAQARVAREASFDIEPGSRYFDVVCEFLTFVLHAADRIAALRLDVRRRAEFTHALECVLARIMDDNGAALAGAVPEASGAHFVRVAALRAPDYSALGCDESGASHAFRCHFGNQVRSRMAAADRPWTVDQVAEIEAPEALDALQRAVRGLLADGTEGRAR